MRVRNPVRVRQHWSGGFEPYRRILEGLVLPPRGPRGSAVNRKRAKMVQDALHAEKVRREKRTGG
jgi:hypothetical protein